MRFLRLSPRGQRRLSRIRESAFGWLVYPFFLVGSFFRWVFGLIGAWWSKRNLRYLLQGLPALLVMIGLGLIYSFTVTQDRAVLAQEYKGKATESLQDSVRAKRAKKDAKPSLLMAQTCYQRLASLSDGETFENRFYLALTLGELEQPAATDAIMRNLGPQNKTGYGPAHLWQAQQFLAAASTPGPDGQPLPQATVANLLRSAEQQLIRATQWKEGPAAHNAHKLLANIYQATNRLADAEVHLREVAEVEPEQRLVLAAWARSGGRPEDAQRYATSAKQRFENRLKVNEDDLQARFALVECHMILAEYANARQLLERGQALANSPELVREYMRAMIKVLTIEYDAKANDPKVSPADRYALLERAMNIDPDNSDLLQRLLQFTKSTGPEGEKSRKAFKNLIAEAKPSAMAHLFLGIDAWQSDNPAEARYHWQKAYDLSAGAPLIANNLAWVMAHVEPIDLPRALSMVDSAIQKAPKDPRMHGTRGHILAKMGRNEEALKDLDEAKKAYPNDPNLFKVLSETCEKLGYKQQAAEYKSRYEQLVKEQANKKGAPASGPTAPLASPEPKATVLPVTTPDGTPKGDAKSSPKVEPKAPTESEPKVAPPASKSPEPKSTVPPSKTPGKGP
ncbi:MAG: hypothetical protein U0746_22520 [Gemmataceae bacterium]